MNTNNNQNSPEVDEPEFAVPQERANILIHVSGILFGLVLAPILIIKSTAKDDSSGVVSACIYSFCFLMMFVSSTLYHIAIRKKLRQLFKKLDRISIYFLIAGTYTPIIWHYLFDQTGIILLCILWGLVLIGILFEVFFPDRFNIFSVASYLVMGMIFLFVPHHFFSALPPSVTVLVLAGVLCYCIGIIFYLWQKWSYHHAIWHGLVLAGGVCHYVAVLHTVS